MSLPASPAPDPGDETPRIDPAAVLRSADRVDGRPVLVLLHGYGADEHDLFSLVPHLPAEFVSLAVRAPLSPPWPTPGHSWYPIDDLRERDPAAITRSARSLLSWLDEAAAGAASVGLLGFSQGGAVALQAMRLAPERFAFAVCLAGYAAQGELAGDAVLAERRPPVFWGRGLQDETIPEGLVIRTTDWLPGHSELSGRVYPGLAHGIHAEELADVDAFLRKRLDDA